MTMFSIEYSQINIDWAWVLSKEKLIRACKDPIEIEKLKSQLRRFKYKNVFREIRKKASSIARKGKIDEFVYKEPKRFGDGRLSVS